MNLEQRVQALEQEVQILKNQIQATLLDIQASLLTNAHPNLRAAELPVPIPAAEPKGSEPPPPAPERQPGVRKISLRDIEAQPVEDEESVVEAPQVTPFPPIKMPPSVAQPPVREAEAPPAAMPSRATAALNEALSAADWATLTKLEDWTRQHVAEIGAARTRTLIEQYARKRKLAPDVTDALLYFISAFETTHGDAEVEVPVPSNQPSSFLQQFLEGVQQRQDELDPRIFLDVGDPDNDAPNPFLVHDAAFAPEWHGATSAPHAYGAKVTPVDFQNGAGASRRGKSKQQLIVRLINGLQNLEMEG